MTTNRQNTRRNNFSFDFRARKKPISKVIKGLPVDYKDVDVLISYISDRAKITSSYRTGNSAKDHRSLTTAIKRARHMALLPISHEHEIVKSSVEEATAETTEQATAETTEESTAETAEEATAETAEEATTETAEEATTETAEEATTETAEEATVETTEKKSEDS